MSDYLTAEEQRLIQKNVRAALRKVHTKHAGRDRESITMVDNENYQPRRSDAEKMIAKMHSTGDGRREIRKAAAPGTNAASAILAMHSDRGLAGRTIAGNTTLVAKLAGAVATVVRKEYGSVREAKAELKKLLSEDALARPRNHVVLKSAQAKSGLATLTLRKGNAYPYIVEVDGYYHSEHVTDDAAERAFTILATGAFGGSDVN